MTDDQTTPETPSPWARTASGEAQWSHAQDPGATAGERPASTGHPSTGAGMPSPWSRAGASLPGPLDELGDRTVAGPVEVTASQALADPVDGAPTARPGGATAAPTSPPTGWRRAAGRLLPGQLLGMLLGLVIGYLATAVLTLLALGGMVLAPVVRTLVMGTVDQLGTIDPFSGLGGLAATVCQLVGLSLGGRLHGTDTALTVSGAAWLTLPVVSVLLVMVLGVHGGVRLATTRRGPAARRTALPGALVAGFVGAVLVLLVTRLGSFGSGDARLHAATPSLFLVAWPLLALASWTGSLRGSGRHLLDGHPLLDEVRRGLGVVVRHLVVFGLVVTVLGGLSGLFAVVLDDGFAAAAGQVLAAPLMAGTVLGALLAVGTGGSLRATGVAGIGRGLTTLADLPTGLMVVVVLGLLAASVVAGLSWAAVRRVGRASRRATFVSWLVLPVLFGLVGVLLLANGLHVGARSFLGGAVDAGYAPTGMTVVGMVLQGVFVELVARVASATGWTPTSRWLGATPGAGSAGSGTAGSGTRRSHRRLLVVAAVVLALVAALAVVATTVGHRMEASTYGPQKQAEAVMDALVAGDVDRVLELAPQQGIQGPLVTRAAYARAQDRPSRYTVSDVRTQGSTAVVSVVASLGTRDVPMSLGLVRTGRHLGLVDTWRVTDLPLVDMTLAVPASATSVLVDGQQVPVQPVAGATGQRTVTLTALPATYTLSLPAVSRYLVAPTVQRQVVPNGQVGVLQLGYSAAPTLATAVDAQMRKAVAACAAQTDLAPAGCPWGLEAGPTQQVRAIHWQVLRQPSAIVQQTQDPGLWQLQTRSTGLARITFEAMDTATGTGTWTKGTQDVDFGANGTVHLDGDTLTVTFR